MEKDIADSAPLPREATRTRESYLQNLIPMLHADYLASHSGQGGGHEEERMAGSAGDQWQRIDRRDVSPPDCESQRQMSLSHSRTHARRL